MPQRRLDPLPSPRRAPVSLWRLGDGPIPAGAFVALVPGADAPLMSVSLPAALTGGAREDVARRQVLDRLGGDGADLDIRPARMASRDGWSRVAVARRADVLQWRAAMAPGAARCRGIVPDYAALPTAPGLWTVTHHDGSICVRLFPSDGFSAEPELAEHMLRQALQQARAAGTLPHAVLWSGERIGALDVLLCELKIVTDANDLPESLCPTALGHNELVLDFARDPHADAVVWQARVRRLVWPLALVAVGALGWSLATVVQTNRDRAAAAELDAQTLSAVRRDLLGTAPVLDLQVQVMREIDRRRAAVQSVVPVTSAMDLLRRAATVLTGIEVRAVVLGAATEGIMLDLWVDDFRTLDTVMGALQDAGLSARLVLSRIASLGGVEATIAVVGDAP